MATIISKVKEVLGLQEPAFESIEEDYSEFDSREYRNLYEDENVREDYPDPVPSRRHRSFASHDGISADLSSRTHRPNRDRSNTGAGKVIGLPGVQNIQGEVILLNPSSFDEMAEVIAHLRDRKAVVMNLNLMDAADAQRSVDFVAGGTYAMDGNQERIGENIFLFTPNCVAVTTQSSASLSDSNASAPTVSPEVPEADMVPPAASYWRAVANG